MRVIDAEALKRKLIKNLVECPAVLDWVLRTIDQMPTVNLGEDDGK